MGRARSAAAAVALIALAAAGCGRHDAAPASVGGDRAPAPAAPPTPAPAPAGPIDCAALRPTVDSLVAGQLRGVPDDQREAATRIAAQLAEPMKAGLVGACEADRWPAAVIRCMTIARDEAGLAACEARLSPEQSQHLAAAMDQAMSATAARAAGPAGDGGVAAASGAGHVAACDDYVRLANLVLACDRFPAAARAELQKSMALLLAGLGDLSDPALPADARAAAARTCAAAETRVRRTAAAAGCRL